MLFCSVFCALLVILSLLLVIMGGQHDGLLLSGSPPILYIYIHMYIFLMAYILLQLLLNRDFKPITHVCKKFRSVYQIDMKFDRQLRPATETSWVVSYGGRTIPRWRTAAILKIVIYPYLSEKSSDFYDILYTAADFELGERHVIKNEKVALERLRVRQNVFLV